MTMMMTTHKEYCTQYWTKQ